MDRRKLPIGIQDFSRLREDGYLYIDKTDLLYRLVREGSEKGVCTSSPARVDSGNRSSAPPWELIWKGERSFSPDSRWNGWSPNGPNIPSCALI
jgi:hypothetical protein